MLGSHSMSIRDIEMSNYNLQNTDTSQRVYGKPTFKKSVWAEDITKSHMKHGTIWN